MEQTCSKCGETKTVDEYYTDNRAKSKRASACKTCCLEAKALDYKKHRGKRLAYRRSYLYGVSQGDYETLHNKSKGVCGICGCAEGSKMALAVDHCHKSGKVRGLLCNNCNNGLGRFKDDPDLLQLAIKYLKENK